jgi:hypothetical protein
MGSLSDYAELELLDHVFNAAYTPAATVYLGLSTADPGDDGAGLAEPSGNGYIRKAITFGAAASRTVTQSGTVTFDQATGPWGTITYWAIFDAESSGNMLAHGALGASKSVVSGNTPSVASGEVTVAFSAGEISDTLAENLLDLMFRNQAYSAPDTYIALVTATVSDSDTGTTITEPSGGAYARVQVEPNGGSSPTWDLAAGGLVDNTHLVAFPQATASWGTIVGVAICSAASAGDMLFYDNDMGDQAVGDGDTAQFPIGDLDITMA